MKIRDDDGPHACCRPFIIFVYLCKEDDNKCTPPCLPFKKNKEDNDELHIHYHCPIFVFFLSPCRENDDEHAIHHHLFKKIKLAFGKNKMITMSCMFIIILFLFWSICPIVKKMTTSVQLVIVFFSFWSVYTIAKKMTTSMQHV